MQARNLSNAMSRRLPACNPCRSSKLSCDHMQPACSRCKSRDMSDACSYRDRPFKKRKLQTPQEEASLIQQNAVTSVVAPTLTEYISRKSQRYPNPGYLGSSSHTTFFDHLSGNEPSLEPKNFQEYPNEHKSTLGYAVTEDKIKQGTVLINEIRSYSKPSLWESLVRMWISGGINLPVAEPFTLSCTTASRRAIDSHAVESTGGCEDPQNASTISRKLFSQSCKPLTLASDADIEAFCDQFCRNDPRWETLGLYFTAVSRATIDITHLSGLYSSEQDRRALRKSAMQYSDACLEIALALDCLNDLQLVLQYENFILHSLVDGDQSKFSIHLPTLKSLELFRPLLQRAHPF